MAPATTSSAAQSQASNELQVPEIWDGILGHPIVGESSDGLPDPSHILWPLPGDGLGFSGPVRPSDPSVLLWPMPGDGLAVGGRLVGDEDHIQN